MRLPGRRALFHTKISCSVDFLVFSGCALDDSNPRFRFVGFQKAKMIFTFKSLAGGGARRFREKLTRAVPPLSMVLGAAPGEADAIRSAWQGTAIVCVQA
jgi:hypothetical protein